MTRNQSEFVSIARAAFPSALISAEMDEYSDCGEIIVTIEEDGNTSSAWVDTDGLLVGNWL